MSTIKNVLNGKEKSCRPIWFMRQAGRHLPEFRKIRSKNNNFIKLCLDSDLSSEITLQPIQRYDLDAAIIFSDILLVPYALGQEVNFVKNEGPNLTKFNLKNFLNNSKEKFTDKLLPIYKAIGKTKKKLNKDKTLISFIGAPWTLLVYMLNLKEGKNEINLNLVNDNKNQINTILNILNEFLCLHIENQINAGAAIVQIFDSWAGLIPQEDLTDYCYNPNLKIVKFCKENSIPVISFPRGIKEKYKEFNSIVKPNGINLDYEINPLWAKENLGNVILQGGMNPKVLLESNEKIFDEAKKYLDIFKDTPYIFNLGHGLIPETNPDKLSKLIKFIRNYK